MKKILSVLLFLPFLAQAQAPTNATTQISGSTAFTPNGWRYKDSMQIQAFNTTLSKWFQLVTGKQFNTYIGTATQSAINAKGSKLRVINDDSTNANNNVSQIILKKSTGISTSTKSGGVVEFELGSGFKTWKVAGQTSLVAIAEDSVTIAKANNGITLATDNTSGSKTLTIGFDRGYTDTAYVRKSGPSLITGLLDLKSPGGFSAGNTVIRIGSDFQANTRTNNTLKRGTITLYPYDQTLNDYMIFNAVSRSTGAEINYGGAATAFFGVLKHDFYTAAVDKSTTTALIHSTTTLGLDIKQGKFGVAGSFGTAGQSIRNNSANTGLEFYTAQGTVGKMVVEGNSHSQIRTGITSAQTWWAYLRGLNADYNKLDFTNYAVSGESIGQMLTEYPTEGHTKAPGVNEYAYFFLEGGGNDIANGRTAAAIYADIVSLCSLARADNYKVLFWTIMPRTTYTGPQEAIRVALNTLILSDKSIYDYIIQPDLLFPNPADATYYLDGIHLTPVGNQYLANAITNALSRKTTIQVINGATNTFNSASILLNPGANTYTDKKLFVGLVSNGTSATDSLTGKTSAGEIVKFAPFNTLGDARYTPLIRTLTGGNGINTIGDLSANRTISADTSVLRTVLNSFSKSAADTRFVRKTGDTMTGQLQATALKAVSSPISTGGVAGTDIAAIAPLGGVSHIAFAIDSANNTKPTWDWFQDATARTGAFTGNDLYLRRIKNTGISADYDNLIGFNRGTGVISFTYSPTVPTPTSGTDAVNKTYADTKLLPTGNGSGLTSLNPANISAGTAGISVTGSAASLSAASALPNNTLATTQSAGDNSTKVATTAYVDAAIATSPSYSEGTWTPTTTIGGGTPYGTYTKIGNLVRAYFQVDPTTSASGSNFAISGLPFTNSATTIGSVIISGTTIGIPITGYVSSGTSIIQFKDLSNTNITDLQFSAKAIYGTVIYSVTN